MNRTPLALAALLSLAACGKNVEPTSLEFGTLLLETFRDADFADEEAEEALQPKLLQLANELSTLADLEYDSGRAFQPPILTADYLGGLPQPTDEDGNPTNFEAQTPEGIAFRSASGFEAHAALVVDPNQNCYGSNSTKFSDRRFTEGGDCFADGSCQHATYDSTSRTENPLAKVWIEAHGDLHRTVVPTEADDLPVIFGRNWIDQTWEGDGGAARWRQRYVLEFWSPDPNDRTRTVKLYVMWSEARITAVGDNLYRSRVREGIEEAFLNTETFLGGTVCEDRDKSKEDWGWEG
jgi:hypothetical protein